MSEARAVPFHCPYCGEETLRPSEEGHGAWECRACLRVFSLRMLGQLARPTSTPDPTADPAPVTAGSPVPTPEARQ